MNKESRHYFACGNTAQGFVNKLPSNLQGTERLFIIRGRPGAGKASMMPMLAEACEKAGFQLEYLHCPSAPGSYDGIIVPALGLAVADGTDLHYTKHLTSYPAAQVIDADAALDGGALLQLDGEQADIVKNIGICHDSAFFSFARALRIHDEWEKIYIAHMDFAKADLLASYTSQLLLGGRRLNKTPVFKERFFGASTPSGATDFIDNLTSGISKRYLLKGRPGTGKSTLLRKLAADSAERGLDTEVYSCAFDSGSLDMLIWPELDICLFDSTAPHLYEPSRPGDEVIDMYASCVKTGTDEAFKPELEDITRRYQDAVREGTAALADAKVFLDRLMEIYSRAFDREAAQGLCAEFTRLLRSDRM
jgi:hypothetical protein